MTDRTDNTPSEAGLLGSIALGAADPLVLDELTRLNNEMAALQRDLARQKSRLARLNALKDEFLAMVAHDLRTPLNVVAMCAALIEESATGELSPDTRHFIQTIRLSSEQMLRMVNHLLDVSVIETGKLRLELKRTDVGDLVRAAVRTHSILDSRKGISLGLRAVASQVVVQADPARLDQVINNLLGNAFKFTSDGGKVEVTVDNSDDEVVIAVADDGVGIAPGDLARLFTAFALRRSRGTPGEQGTGLGLAISKKIDEAHHGRIWAKSELGTGSTFFVALPASTDG